MGAECRQPLLPSEERKVFGVRLGAGCWQLEFSGGLSRETNIFCRENSGLGHTEHLIIFLPVFTMYFMLCSVKHCDIVCIHSVK